MNRARVLQEIRIMRFEEIYQWQSERKLTNEEAAEMLGVCERTYRRWCLRYEEEGVAGLLDGRLDKAAHNCAPVDEVIEVISLYETYYINFSVSHFYDRYRDVHKGQRSYTWVKSRLQEAGFVRKAKKRGAHRRKRERRPLKGMMLHQDASKHEWVEGQQWDLVVTMDDADNEIYSAIFVEEEGTQSSFQGVQEVIENQGLFCSLYTDRGSHYWTTKKAGAKVESKELTQFGRAMQQLGIEMIAAYSPEARGRSERMFRTLQGRLPKELALSGIREKEEANRYMAELFLPSFNARFKVKTEEEITSFVPWLDSHVKLREILCVQSQREVKKDNTVSYRGKILQIERNEKRYSYAKAKVRVHEYADGELAIYYGHCCLGRYDDEGRLLNGKEREQEAA